MSSIFDWTPIFRDAVPDVAGVIVYDKCHSDSLGRYTIAKIMRLPSGRTRTTQSYAFQRPAALRQARKFLTVRAEKAGKTWKLGDGAGTMSYKPIFVGGEK